MSERFEFRVYHEYAVLNVERDQAWLDARTRAAAAVRAKLFADQERDEIADLAAAQRAQATQAIVKPAFDMTAFREAFDGLVRRRQVLDSTRLRADNPELDAQLEFFRDSPWTLEAEMEKRGVVTTPDEEALHRKEGAVQDKTCPLCGRSLAPSESGRRTSTGTFACTEHGTAPFER